MIDDKKIEEAALAYEKKTQVECEKLNKKLGGNEFSVTYKSADAAFKDGAHWAINEFMKDLWHDASEKPVMSEHGMIIVELNDITACKYSLWRSTTTYECLCNNKGYIRRWLYLDEITKTD